jgi:cob(I)alamin adenosyltransferase
MEKGYVHVYTGNGKGKTTAMLGLALRATGAGLRVYIGQFIKNGEYSEVKAIRQYLPDVELEQYGTGFVTAGAVTETETEANRNGLKKAAEAMYSGRYDVVMLDEINTAAYCGLIAVSDIIDIIRGKPCNVELILTGRYAAKEIVEAADLVSEIAEVKHYYARGVTARTGIEK